VAKIVGRAPQQKIQGADKVLESVLVKVDSGNVAICTPAITGTRAIVYMSWTRPPAESEVNEVCALLETMGMPKPEKVDTASTPEEAGKWVTDYLKKGKQ
jgi:hypothetical protein